MSTRTRSSLIINRPRRLVELGYTGRFLLQIHFALSVEQMNDAVQQHCLRFTGSDSIFGAIGYLQRLCPIFSAILARYIINVIGIIETMPILGRSDSPPRDDNLVSFYRHARPI